jgi:aminoglycoside phosphotransferase (APT) family kinase protein
MARQLVEGIAPSVVEWVQGVLGAAFRIHAILPAQGATSSSVYFVTGVQAGRLDKYVLRLHTNREWLREEPDLAGHEFAILKKARSCGLPSPEPIAVAEDDTACGVPAVLMSFVAGRIELRPDDFELWLMQLAENLARIHSFRADDLPWKYRSWTRKTDLTPPVWSTWPGLWARAIDFVLHGEPAFEPVFIHRDYHPTNVLWTSGRLTGIVDWVNGCQGPAGVDLAHCRLNLTAMYGPSVAEKFLDAYRQATGGRYVHHPYWDLDAILDILPDPGLYPPWKEFGLELIPQEELRARDDELLRAIVNRL